MNILDISMPVTEDMPVWPGSPGVATELRLSLARGDDVNVTQLELDVHTGTHVDAPRHFLQSGSELEEMGLEPLVGVVEVVDLTQAEVVDAKALSAVVPAGAQRVLLKTRNSLLARFRSAPFQTDYAAISSDGARWLAGQGIALVGVDYLSVQGFNDPPDAHTALLSHSVILLEGLVLNHVAAGRYLLVCLPIRLLHTEAAPARAILLPLAEAQR